MTQSSTRHHTLLVFAFCVAPFVQACKTSHNPTNSMAPAKKSQDNTAESPNPASAYCKNVGGKSEIYKSPEGDVGICGFDSGLIDEWTLYRTKTDVDAPTPDAVKIYLNPIEPEIDVGGGGANPASLYCEKRGGQSVNYESQQGATGMCRFSDHSAIEEWTLYSGPESPKNTKLTAVLRAK